jgi:hypothetical protein
MDYGQVTAAYPQNNGTYTQIVSAQANTGAFTLVNPSTNTVTAFLSSNQSGNPAVNDDVPLGPGGFVVLDGTADTFCYTAVPGTKATLYKLPSGTQYSSGTIDIGTVSGDIDVASVSGNVNVLGAVNATGVGGYITPGQIGTIYNNAGSLTVPANTTSSIAQFNVTTFASVVFSVAGISNSSVAAGAAVCAIFKLAWQDINGNNLAIDTLSCIAGGAATWDVPIRGSLLNLEIQNCGTVGIITIAADDVFIDGSFRVIPNVRVSECQILSTPVLTGCTVQTQSQPVYQITPWVANISYSYTVAVTNVVFPLALWCGEAAGFYDITGAALSRNLTIVDLSYAVQGGVVSGSGYTAGIILSIPPAVDTAVVPFSLNLPPTQCAVIADVSAGPGAITMALVGIGNL